MVVTEMLNFHSDLCRKREVAHILHRLVYKRSWKRGHIYLHDGRYSMFWMCNLTFVFKVGSMSIWNGTQPLLDFACSSVPAKNYPFYGVQWHPEVNRFQWAPDVQFPHSPYAVRVSSLLAEFYIDEGELMGMSAVSSETSESFLLTNRPRDFWDLDVSNFRHRSPAYLYYIMYIFVYPI